MIYDSTLKNLTEEELSILFLISDNFLKPLGIDTKYNFLKMLRVDVILKMVDILKPQALENNREIFDNLKKKLSE